VRRGGSVPGPLRRALADRQDGVAAFKRADIVMGQEEPRRASDAARYYSIAAATGRGGAIQGMIKAIDMIEPETVSPARLQVLLDLLMTYARAGNSQAVSALLRYHLEEAPFGPLDEDVEAIVLNASGAASAPVALQMATAILQSENPSRARLERARDFLMVAKEAETLSTALTATNLLAQVDVALISAPRYSLDFEVRLQ